MRTALVMDNRFFVISLIVIGCLVLTGCILFPLVGIGLCFHKTKNGKEFSDRWIVKQSKKLGLRVGYVKLKD